MGCLLRKFSAIEIIEIYCQPIEIERPNLYINWKKKNKLEPSQPTNGIDISPCNESSIEKRGEENTTPHILQEEESQPLMVLTEIKPKLPKILPNEPKIEPLPLPEIQEILLRRYGCKKGFLSHPEFLWAGCFGIESVADLEKFYYGREFETKFGINVSLIKSFDSREEDYSLNLIYKSIYQKLQELKKPISKEEIRNYYELEILFSYVLSLSETDNTNRLSDLLIHFETSKIKFRDPLDSLSENIRVLKILPGYQKEGQLIDLDDHIKELDFIKILEARPSKMADEIVFFNYLFQVFNAALVVQTGESLLCLEHVLLWLNGYKNKYIDHETLHQTIVRKVLAILINKVKYFGISPSTESIDRLGTIFRGNLQFKEPLDIVLENVFNFSLFHFKLTQLKDFQMPESKYFEENDSDRIPFSENHSLKKIEVLLVRSFCISIAQFILNKILKSKLEAETLTSEKKFLAKVFSFFKKAESYIQIEDTNFNTLFCMVYTFWNDCFRIEEVDRKKNTSLKKRKDSLLNSLKAHSQRTPIFKVAVRGVLKTYNRYLKKIPDSSFDDRIADIVLTLKPN